MAGDAVIDDSDGWFIRALAGCHIEPVIFMHRIPISEKN